MGQTTAATTRACKFFFLASPRIWYYWRSTSERHTLSTREASFATRKRVHSLRSKSAREAHSISEQREHAQAYQSRALTRLAMNQTIGVACL